MTGQEFTTTEIMRLEVEDDVIGLPNLVKNPDGALGAWGYVTPVANTAITVQQSGGLPALAFATTVSQPSNFTTEYLPVSAGKYVASRFYLALISVGHNVKITFDFYNSSKSLISSSAQSGALSGNTTTQYVAAALAPAGTAYVKMRWNLYNGTSNPSANAGAWVRQVMVTWASTMAALTTVRKNLVYNPSAELNTTAWGPNVGTVAQSSAQAYIGTKSIALTAPAGGGDCGCTWSSIGASGSAGITGGLDYAFQVRIRAKTTGRTVRMRVQWEKAGAYIIGTVTLMTVVDATTGWALLSGVLTAPSNAVSATVYLDVLGAGASEVHYFDAGMVEQASSVGDYFDGSFASGGGVTYTWSGTAHNSYSTMSSTPLVYAQPTTWRNILGPAHEIKVTREGFNLGTIAATVLDARLDPSQETLLRPGRQVRLVVLSGAVWVPLFTGEISNAKVSYDYKTPGIDDGRRARIELTGNDAMAKLANQAAASGVATIAALPYVLEGGGVPWNVNGSGNQVLSATVVASNDNASLADQIAVTRDTALGYAWVDRKGIVQVWDNNVISSTPASTVDEDDYSDIEIDYDTDRCINEVNVKLLRFNLATGETVEVPYGPYVDAASVGQWGEHSADFTVQGLAEDGVAIPAYAQKILTANSVPQVRINSVVLPVTTAAIAAKVAGWDLYTLLTVANADAGISDGIRVVTMEHSITPGKWLTTLGFETDDSVSQPTFTPSPPAAGASTDGTWITVGAAGAPAFTNAWANYGSGFAAVAFMRKNGIVYLKGMIKSGAFSNPAFVLPVGYRPAAARYFASVTAALTTGAASAGTAHTHQIVNPAGVIEVTIDGWVYPVTGSNTYMSLDSISFPAEL